MSTEQVNARSNRLKKIYELQATPDVELAAAIVHLAYNYVLEDSISEVSKHYDDTQGIAPLFNDFAHRIDLFWQEHTKNGLHELHNTQNVAIGDVWNTILKWEAFPEWETAVRVTDKNGVVVAEKKVVYEDSYNQDRKNWRKKLGKTVLLQILIAFAYIILIHIFNEVTGGIQSVVDILVGFLGLNLHPVVSLVVNLVIYTLLLGMFSSYISKN